MARGKIVCENGHVFESTPFKENVEKKCPKCGSTDCSLGGNR
jgi:Zn finger protein HypA/HybF involved in hydrogenase expression